MFVSNDDFKASTAVTVKNTVLPVVKTCNSEESQRLGVVYSSIFRAEEKAKQKSSETSDSVLSIRLYKQKDRTFFWKHFISSNQSYGLGADIKSLTDGGRTGE
jgi:hypothetical protein